MEIRPLARQIHELTIASIKSRYRKTWAGFLWVIINPLLMFGVQSLVFRKFLRLDMPNYYLFLLGGLLPWIFMTSTILMGTPIFVSQSQLLRSFKINPWVVLGSQVMDNFVNFIASFLIIMMPFYISSDKPLEHLLLLPVAFLPLLIGTLGITITLSVLNVFFRDINFVMGFVFNLLFFLTPIFYPRVYVPAEFHWIVDLNPLIYFIEPFRVIIYSESLIGFLPGLMNSFLTGIGFFLLALLTWHGKKNDFYRKL